MKKIISFAFVLGLMMLPVLSVKADSMNLKSVETIIAEIRQEQNILSTDSINISEVTSDRLEELGDSVMEQVIGNTSLHERMDIAFGGEGSANLANVHIRVGYNYLAGIPITMMTFMGGGGMMGGYGYFPQNDNYYGYGGMMSGYSVGWMVFGLFGLVGLIIGIAYLVTRSLKQKSMSSGNDALNILKIRYARGEITHDEFLRMSEHFK